MLDGLSLVEWSALEHAYGSATDVPGDLRRLASPERSDRESAHDALWGSICHQGTVYPATEAAVPFLLELLGEPGVENKEAILYLVAGIAGGHGDRPGLGGRIRDAVHSGLGPVIACLDDEARIMRVTAVWVLRALEHPSEAAFGVLAVRARSDPYEDLRAACWLGLGATAPDAARFEAVHAAQAPDDDGVVALAAAIARAQVLGATLADEDVARLDRLVRQVSNARALTGPAGPMLPLGSFLRPLTRLPDTRLVQLMPAITELLRQVPDQEFAFRASEDLLGRAFPEPGTVTDPDELSALQRAVLSCVAHAPAAWRVANTCMDVADALGWQGLLKRDELLGWLGEPSPPP